MFGFPVFFSRFYLSWGHWGDEALSFHRKTLKTSLDPLKFQSQNGSSLFYAALFLLQKRLMSSVASRKHRVQARALKNVRLRVGTYQDESGASAHVVALCFCHLSHDWHKQMPLSTKRLWKNFPQSHCAWRLSSLSWSSSFTQSSTFVMVSFTSMAHSRAWQLNK